MTTLLLQHHDLNLFDGNSTYINCNRIYFAYYKKIPNIIRIKKVNERLFNNWITEIDQDKIINKHSCKRYDNENKRIEDINVIYFFKNEILIDNEYGNISIAHQEAQEEEANEILMQLSKMIVHEKTNHEFYLIASTKNGFLPIGLHLIKPKLDLSKHYNDDILPMHSTILKTLKQKNKSGLILFHGQPGTGKSTYIRYLVHHLKKNIIFMPPKIAGNLDAPEFTQLLILNQNAVFIIEDAEDLLA